MRNSFFLLLSISLTFGACSGEEKEEYVDCERLNLDVAYNHLYETDRTVPYNGVCKVFYPNGNVKQVREIVDGKNHGKFELYNEGGVLVEEGTFYENLHHGVFKYYNDEGELIEQVEYALGRPKR